MLSKIVSIARLHKNQYEMDQIRERDNAENREMLQSIATLVTARRSDTEQPQSSQSMNIIQAIQQVRNHPMFQAFGNLLRSSSFTKKASRKRKRLFADNCVRFREMSTERVLLEIKVRAEHSGMTL